MGLKKITFTRASVLTVLLLIFCVFFFSCAHNAGVADDITLEDGTVISALTLNGEEIYAVTFINDNGKDTYVVPDVVLDGKRIRVICEKALQEYSSIRTLIIQDNITDFEMDLYFNYPALESVYIGAGVNRITEMPFAHCPNLRQVTVDIRNEKYYSEDNFIIEKETGRIIAACAAWSKLPESPSIIGGNSFCLLAQGEIAIPEHISRIEKNAFQGCEGLDAVYIPKSVTVIEENAFAGCGNAVIYCEVAQKPSRWDENWDNGVKNVVWGTNGR